MTLPLGAAGPSAYWYLTRGTGAVALLLLTASVVLGVLGSQRFAVAPRWPRFAIDTLHRDTSLLVIVVLVVHIVTSVLDGFAPITLLDGVIPFRSPYRPLWLGLGAVSFDLLLALAITSLVRRRLGYRTWRAVHWLAYACWPIAVLHGLGTGTDTKQGWNLILTAACVAAVVIAVLARAARTAHEHDAVRGTAAAAVLAVAAGIAIFTFAGPLQKGWARRAGTPTHLLVSAPVHRVIPTPVAARPAVATLKPPFNASVSGNVTETPESGGAIVDIALRLSGGATGQLRVRLGGIPLGGGGLSLTGSQVVLQADGLASVMEGQVVSLQGSQFVARLRGANGSHLDLNANLTINPDNSVTGSVSAT